MSKRSIGWPRKDRVENKTEKATDLRFIIKKQKKKMMYTYLVKTVVEFIHE